MEVSGELQASAALPPGKSPRYPLDKRLGWFQKRSESCGGGKKSFLAPAGNLNPIVQLLADSLYWLSYPRLHVLIVMKRYYWTLQLLMTVVC